jgi:hypothetical protein
MQILTRVTVLSMVRLRSSLSTASFLLPQEVAELPQLRHQHPVHLLPLDLALPSGDNVVVKVGLDLHAVPLDLPARLPTPTTRNVYRYWDRGLRMEVREVEKKKRFAGIGL